jgi:CysZ protein
MAIDLILAAFSKALSQIGDRRFRRVLLLGVGLTVALLLAIYAPFLGLLNWIVGPEATLPFFGKVTWLDNLLGWGSFFAMLAASTFLMVPVASAISSLFLDQVAQAVEDKHYSALPAATNIGLIEALRDTLSFLGVLIVANLLALVVYGVFLLTAVLAPLAPLVFWLLNGYLLGREYFQLAAMRRIGRKNAKALRKRHAFTIWVAGTLMAIPLSIPLVSLIIPILGAATFTHLFHGLKNR